VKIVTFCNVKGGSGKSTVIALLSLFFGEKRGKRIGIRDLDHSQDSADFTALTDHPNIVIADDGQEYDLVLVDTPAGTPKDELNELAELSDLVIIPLSPTPLDIKNSGRTVAMLSNTDKVRLLFNRVDRRTTAFKAREQVARDIGLVCLDSYISGRALYTYAITEGYKRLDRNGVEELSQLAGEIMGCLNSQTR